MAFATLRAGVSVRPRRRRAARTPAASRRPSRQSIIDAVVSRCVLPNVPRAARRPRARDADDDVFFSRVGRRASNGRRGGNVTSRPPTLAEPTLAPSLPAFDPRATRVRPRPSPDLAPLAPHRARRQTTRVAPPDGGFSAETTDDVVAPPEPRRASGAPSTSPTPTRSSTVRGLPRRRRPHGQGGRRGRARPPPAPTRASARLAAPRSTCETSSRAR